MPLRRKGILTVNEHRESTEYTGFKKTEDDYWLCNYIVEILVNMIASSRKRILQAGNAGKVTISIQMVVFSNFISKIMRPSWPYSTAIKFGKSMYQKDFKKLI